MAPSPPALYLPFMRPEEFEPLHTRDAATESDLALLIDREFAVIGERLRRVDGTGKLFAPRRQSRAREGHMEQPLPSEPAPDIRWCTTEDIGDSLAQVPLVVEAVLASEPSQRLGWLPLYRVCHGKHADDLEQRTWMA